METAPKNGETWPHDDTQAGASSVKQQLWHKQQNKIGRKEEGRRKSLLVH